MRYLKTIYACLIFAGVSGIWRLQDILILLYIWWSYQSSFRTKVKHTSTWRPLTFDYDIKETLTGVSWPICAATLVRCIPDAEVSSGPVSAIQENVHVGVIISTQYWIPCHCSFLVIIEGCVYHLIGWAMGCWTCYICMSWGTFNIWDAVYNIFCCQLEGTERWSFQWFSTPKALYFVFHICA